MTNYSGVTISTPTSTTTAPNALVLTLSPNTQISPYVTVTASNGVTPSISATTASSVTTNPVLGALSSSWTPNYANVVAYYKFDETSGSTTIIDAISARNGTVQNTLTLGSAGMINTCATFNGTTSWINIPSAAINNISSGTIMCWVYPKSLTNGTICIKQHDGIATYAGLTIGYYNSTGGNSTPGTSGIVYWHSNNNQSVAASASASAIPINTWTHITVTFTSTTVKIYFNGVLNSTTSTNGSIPDDTTCTTSIGGWYTSGNLQNTFNGSIDDFSVWNTELTSANISLIYSAL